MFNIGKLEGFTYAKPGSLMLNGYSAQHPLAFRNRACAGWAEQCPNDLKSFRRYGVDDVENYIEKMPPEQRQVYLVRALANLSIFFQLERIYGVIWSSQVACLRYLNSQVEGVPRAELKPLYDLAKAHNELLFAHYTFERWLAYLLDEKLILEDAGKIKITIKGSRVSQVSRERFASRAHGWLSQGCACPRD